MKNLRRAFFLFMFLVVAWAPLAGVAQNEKQELADKQAELQVLADKMAQLRMEYAEKVQKYKDAHPSVQQNLAQIAEVSELIRRQKEQMGMIAEDEVYDEIAQKAKELAKAISKLNPSRESERGFNEAMEIIQRTLDEVATKRSAADAYRKEAEAYRRNAAAAMDSAKQRYAELAQQIADNEDRLTKVREKEAMDRYKQIAVLREKEMAAMQAQLQQAESEIAQRTQRQAVIAADAARAIAAQRAADLADASQGAKQNVSARLDRVEDELAQIKAMLKEIVEREKKRDK